MSILINIVTLLIILISFILIITTLLRSSTEEGGMFAGIGSGQGNNLIGGSSESDIVNKIIIFLILLLMSLNILLPYLKYNKSTISIPEIPKIKIDSNIKDSIEPVKSSKLNESSIKKNISDKSVKKENIK